MRNHHYINNKDMGNICISNGASKLAELDTTIFRYNREYPNVGFPISQATETAYPMVFVET